MCILIKKTRRKTVVGYKVIAKHKETDDYYSTVTSQKYNIGYPIKKMNSKSRRMTTNWNRVFDIATPKNLNIGTWCLNSNYNGFTAIFINNNTNHLYYNIKGSTYDKNIYNIIKCKVTLGGEIYIGVYDGYSVYCGTKILKIEEL